MAFRWLLDAHSESGKSRPMTVLPPYISISVPTTKKTKRYSAAGYELV